MLCKYLESHNVLLNGRNVLDLGSGLGGYTVEWHARGGQVTALDLAVASPVIRESAVPFVEGDARSLPFASDSFDVVFCASLIEHVPKPKWLLHEVRRVLRSKGICYLSFPPFYSPRGGHEFSPFHYLGEKAALRLAKRDRNIPDWLHEYYDIPAASRSFAETYQGWGLYRVTILQARSWVKEASFRIRHLGTRYLPLNLAAIPVLGEILAWHVQMILEKADRPIEWRER
jgi:ubiquinone/menaquinone biosynthesis C-methylase UbiE